ncbi:uncharacterized protein LJ264_008647 [Porphyrio hochstetteri]
MPGGGGAGGRFWHSKPPGAWGRHPGAGAALVNRKHLGPAGARARVRQGHSGPPAPRRGHPGARPAQTPYQPAPGRGLRGDRCRDGASAATLGQTARPAPPQWGEDRTEGSPNQGGARGWRGSYLAPRRCTARSTQSPYSGRGPFKWSRRSEPSARYSPGGGGGAAPLAVQSEGRFPIGRSGAWARETRMQAAASETRSGAASPRSAQQRALRRAAGKPGADPRSGAGQRKGAARSRARAAAVPRRPDTGCRLGGPGRPYHHSFYLSAGGAARSGLGAATASLELERLPGAAAAPAQGAPVARRAPLSLARLSSKPYARRDDWRAARRPAATAEPIGFARRAATSG